MKKLIALTLCLLAASASAEEVRRTVTASADGRVNIINPAGEIEVIGWSRNEVEVVGELDEDIKELIVAQDNGEILVKVKAPRSKSKYRSKTARLEVHVPQNSSLHITSVSADVDVNDVEGAQRVHTVSGDVDIDAFAADIDVETVSGDVEIAGNGSAVRTRATSVSGDVELTNLAGEFESRSVTGDVTIVAGTFSRAEMTTTNGDLVFRAGLLDKGRLDVETINGDIDLEFAGGLSARFDIETFNGSIDSCFGPAIERKNEYGPGRKMLFKEGSGSGRVIIRTLNGDLRMCRD